MKSAFSWKSKSKGNSKLFSQNAPPISNNFLIFQLTNAKRILIYPRVRSITIFTAVFFRKRLDSVAIYAKCFLQNSFPLFFESFLKSHSFFLNLLRSLLKVLQDYQIFPRWMLRNCSFLNLLL